MKRSCDDFDDSEGSGLFVGKKTRIDCWSIWLWPTDRKRNWSKHFCFQRW
jgi:hypothetical protein